MSHKILYRKISDGPQTANAQNANLYSAYIQNLYLLRLMKIFKFSTDISFFRPCQTHFYNLNDRNEFRYPKGKTVLFFFSK